MRTHLVDILGPRFQAVAADGLLAFQALRLKPRSKILDVGTGSGNFAILLASEGHSVLTGEPDTDTTQYSRRPWAESARQVGVIDHIHFQSFNAGRMPFETGSFDAVCFFGVLHHIDVASRTKAFSEAMRVSNQQGAVVFFEPRQNMLEKIWLDDPDHPLAADPSTYQPKDAPPLQKIEGAWMDVYIYVKSPAIAALAS